MTWLKNIKINFPQGSQLKKSTPALHTTKRSGKPVGAGHLARHEKGTAHPSVGEVIGKGVNKVKETVEVVNEKVIKPTTEAVKTIVNDTKKTINKKTINK